MFCHHRHFIINIIQLFKRTSTEEYSLESKFNSVPESLNAKSLAIARLLSAEEERTER